MNDISKLLEEKMKNGREYRRIEIEQIETRAEENGEMIVEGYATKFGTKYLLYDWGDYRVFEQIDAAAFNDCDMDDVILQYDHEGRVYARTSNKTLEVEPDAIGLRVRAKLSGTEGGRQLYEEIKGGYITKMSFGFVVSKDEQTVEEDRETNITTVTRTITGIKKLYDVSAVSIPANDATEISARAFGEGVISEAMQERQRAERSARIKKLKILTEV